MRTVYQNPPVQISALAAGQYAVAAIPFPSRVRLTRMNVIQSDGLSGETFEATIYSSAVTATPDVTDELSRATEKASGTAGSVVEFFDGVDRFVFNTDTPTFQGTVQRMLYVRIKNTGSVAHDYKVVVQAEDQS